MNAVESCNFADSDAFVSVTSRGTKPVRGPEPSLGSIVVASFTHVTIRATRTASSSSDPRLGRGPVQSFAGLVAADDLDEVALGHVEY